MARTALHALEADAGTPRAPGTTPRPGTLQPDEPSRDGNPTMSSTDQQADAPAPADADVPAEHEVPDDLALAAEFDAATREQWRELVAGVLRKAGREDLPDPVEDALRRTVATGVTVAPLYTAEDAGDLPTAVGVPGAARRSCAVARAGGGSRERRARAAGTSGSGTRTPTSAVTREAIAADLENGVTSLWLVLGEGAIPVDALGDVLSDVLLDLAPVTVQGGLPAAEAFLTLVDGRTDLAPGGSLGLDPLGVQAATGQAQDLVRAGRRRPPGRRARRACARSSSTPPCSPTPAPRPWRSSAARWPPASPTCGRSPRAG